LRESEVEQPGVKFAEGRGWFVYKASSPGNTGIHDQLHHKNVVTFYIEYKAPGKKASPKQLDFARKLRAAGIVCRCIDNVPDARHFIKCMTAIADGSKEDIAFELLLLSDDISSFDP